MHRVFIAGMASLLLVCSHTPAAEPKRPEPASPPIASSFDQGAVVSVSTDASNVGVEILKSGGNAVDAAVATAFALAVTYPAAGNIGGGGYLLFVPRGSADPVVIDFRETAPAATTADMFVRPELRTPHRRIGVPGTVRGLALAQSRFGKLGWKELLAPAIRLAREGFLLDASGAAGLQTLLKTSDRQRFAELHRVFSTPDGEDWKAGDRLIQADLAVTLDRLATEGPDAFYRGPIAGQIVSEMQQGGGLITLQDLAAYQPVIRTPLRGTYRGHEILSVPPSSSGGTTLIEMLNILETFDLRASGRNSPETLHLMIEAMKRAYRDRAACLGDPATVAIPVRLVSKDNARELARSIHPCKATPALDLAGEIPITLESEQTTHFSVVDRDRNAVSLTCTLENSWGSRVVVQGAGFLLNDEMNDFNWLPGVTDTQGRIGTEPNQAAPGKRMLSSMCPTIVRRDGKLRLVTGSPGGRTIINTVLCVIVNVVDFDLDVQSAIDAPRIHHQWLPDHVRVEPGFAPELLDRLRALGHAVATPARQGDAHSIAVDPQSGRITGAADHRISGHAAGY